MLRGLRSTGIARGGGEVKIVTVKLPEPYIDGIDRLVESGRYMNRSDAIRAAVRELLRRELWAPEPYASAHRKRAKVVEIG